MRGLMMQAPLRIPSLLEHAARDHGDTEIVSRLVDGSVHRSTYGEALTRSKKLAQALGRLGVRPGDRVATLAWNGHRHLELYYAISGMGAICHTINPRLFAEQLVYIVGHAEDSWIALDVNLVPLAESLAPQMPGVKGWILLCGADDRAGLRIEDVQLDNVLVYEELLAAEDGDYEWPELEEDTAASLCYTSGTTGNPKGVLYSHRSTILHSYAACLPDAINLSARDAVLPVVPMFHANAWGLPYAAPLVGAKLVFPGPHMDGASLHELIEGENVTVLAGVPTIWLMLLAFLEESGERLDGVQRVIIGGSAAPRAMVSIFENDYDVEVLHAWGMTEMSPLGTVSQIKTKHLKISGEEFFDLRLKQGRAVYGVEMKIVGDDGEELPRDGKTFGELLVRGPWIAREYLHDKESILRDGWFPTGDVATLDADGYMQITDRAKDVIKSGGEWISSIDLENEAVGHPKVAEAAVIGVAHPKWDERPLLVVVPVKGQAAPSREEMHAFLESRVAKWWLPDEVVAVEEMPHTATGKISKRALRERFKDYVLSGQDLVS